MKKLLLSIFVLGLSFLSFSNAGEYTLTGSVDLTPSSGDPVFILPIPVSNNSFAYPNSCPSFNVSCTFSNVKNYGYAEYRVYYRRELGLASAYKSISSNFLTINGITVSEISTSISYCANFYYFSLTSVDGSRFRMDYTCTFTGDYISDQGGSCPTCPEQYTSEQCQSVYGLVTSGSLNACQSDLESCESFTNGFNQQLNNCNSSLNACNSSLTSCLQSNCPETSGDVAWSNIYINDILFPGKPLVNILIPDYITWDYTGSDVSFDVYVGSGYDVDYINSIVDINSYRPSSEDFTNIFVGGLTLIFPYIFVALLILFIWKLVKRIFK